ncbi:MIP/aquaporin family protein, partial [Liquorilactobacillus nagelii]
MDYALSTRLAAEFFGTAIMVALGNGSVATVDLEKTKGSRSGWIVISVGYGFAVMIPALMFGSISGNHINPAFTIGLAAAGLFPWTEVLPYIGVQFLGAIVGQLIVIAAFKPHYDL